LISFFPTLFSKQFFLSIRLYFRRGVSCSFYANLLKENIIFGLENQDKEMTLDQYIDNILYYQ